MYPPLGSLLTNIYSICFPIADYKKLPADKKKKLSAFLRRIERLEQDDSLTNFTIGEFLTQGAENLDPLFPTSNIPIYIGLLVHMFLKDYTNKTVLDFPTYYDRTETTLFLYEAFLPRVLDICEAIYEQFTMLREKPRLPPNWYLPTHGDRRAPFIETLSWIQARYESSAYGLGKDAEARLGITFDATKKRISRWKSGKNLPNAHECISLLGIPVSDEKARLFIYASLALSQIYKTFPASIDIDTSLRSISRFGIDTYLHSINRIPPQELCDLAKSMMDLLGEARKSSGIKKNKVESFLNQNSNLIAKYNYQYMAETLWGRYYLLTANDPQTARSHYEKAFEDGKYRGGRYQKQICNDFLYCLRLLNDRRAFRRVYYWLRLYESFFANIVTLEEVEFENVYENNYKSIPFLYREENGEIIYQP